MSNGFEVRSPSRKAQTLAAFFHEEDGKGIVDMLQVGPLVYPLIRIGIFWEFAWKAEAVDLFCRESDFDANCAEGRHTQDFPYNVPIGEVVYRRDGISN